ncbi:DUF2589 domain-containing protein [Paraliomyxa miuraensis]|uniref:DUF2589 domain-containing protein n=1 Tax=Paraliomyxa miuraensis TaxID=376150 RepID=UPI00225258E3|nr:DUF2589 domain-containing protein [Paraliomyxa miuraensis]MCX4244709.1 DUF2589 domain-containing protein [Paraliomyxa miuraensis]
MIGGPLQAAVEAQRMAAESTIEFIEKVGFVHADDGTPTSDLRNVTFTYAKDNEGVSENFSLTVPLLAIMPIPFIRIDEVNIEFSAKLNDVVRSEQSAQSNFGGSVSASARWGWGKASIRASYSTARKSSSSSSFESEYQMNVKVRAGAAPMPEGMAKILDILESVITEQPAA